MNKDITIFLLIGIVVALLIMKVSSCNNANAALKSKDNLISSLQDSLKVVKHKNGSSTSTISVIQADPKVFLALQVKDSQITRLQKVVSDYKHKLVAGSSVTQGLIETVADLEKRTPPTITMTDTVKGKDNIVYVYPTYTDSMVNKWISLHSTMSRDSSSYQIGINNSFSAVIGQDKKKPFVEINLDNPYSTVKTLRSYQVSIPRPKRVGIGPEVGYGLSTGLQPHVYIGIGIHYDIIKF